MFNESMVNLSIDSFSSLSLCRFRITGEPLFGNATDGLMYSDEQLEYHDSDEQSPLANSGGSAGFSFPAHGADFGQLLSAAIGHRQMLHAGAEYPADDDESDDEGEEDMYGESDDEEGDDNDDESSEGDLDE